METMTMNIDDWVVGANSFVDGLPDETWRQEFVGAAMDKGLPTRKTEAWKYTRIKPLFTKGLQLNSTLNQTRARSDEKGREEPAGLKKYFTGIHINTRNGHLISSDDLPNGISIYPIAEAAKPSQHFISDSITAIAAATYSAGIVIKIEAGVVVDGPIIINEKTSLSKGEIACVRNCFEVAEQANVQVIEHQCAEKDSEGLINRITEMQVSENAQFDHHQIQDINQLNLVHSIQVQQARSSVFNTAVYSFSGNLTRNDLSVSVNGERCETNLYGLHITDNKEHVDNHTHIDHRVPNCNSKEVYRGVLGGRSTGVFNGKVFVHQDAQLTNAHQSNRNILISDSATMNSKPELEIYADDVKCSHGCTIGQMDKEAMFYLRSRGLSVEDSINLLLHAFAGEVLTAISNEELRRWVEERIERKMALMNSK